MVLSSAVARNALVVVAVILTGSALLWAGAILTPLVLALFLLVMVDGFARFIARRVPVLPEWSALPVALALSTVIFGLCVYLVVDNAAAFAAELIADAPRLQGVIAGVAGAIGVKVPPTAAEMISQLNPTSYLVDVARYLQTFGMGAFAVLIYLGFLIASRQGFEKKVNSLFPDPHDRDHATAVFVRIRDGVQRYLWIQTVGALMIALPAGALMAALGLDNAIFWAFFIFIASYIPVIGGAIGTVLPPLFALVQFPGFAKAVTILVGLEMIMFFVGNVLQPKMQRDSLNIDPVVVLLSLAFWGAIWGLPGMFLSTPLTVTGIVILAQFHGSRWIAVLLSGMGSLKRRLPLRRGGRRRSLCLLPSRATSRKRDVGSGALRVRRRRAAPTSDGPDRPQGPGRRRRSFPLIPAPPRSSRPPPAEPAPPTPPRRRRVCAEPGLCERRAASPRRLTAPG